MGFMDKVKTAAKNADTKMGNAIDKEKLDSKIHDEEKIIRDTTNEIGKKVVEALKAGKTAAEADLDDLYNRIKTSEAKIEDLKKQKEAIGKEEPSEEKSEEAPAEEKKE